MGKCFVEVLVVIEPHCVLGRTANLLFIYVFNYVIVTDVIVTGPDVISSCYFIVVVVVHNVSMEPCEFQGVTISLMLWAIS